MIVTKNNFEEGITQDIRDETVGAVKMIKHFDILTRPHSLTPFHSQISGDKDSATQCMTDFLYYNSIAYGIGDDSGTNKTTVHIKSDFTSDTWTSIGNNVSDTGGFIRGVFVEYKGGGFGFQSNGSVFRNDLAGATWVDAITTIESGATTGSIAGIVHSKDNALYLGNGNTIKKSIDGINFTLLAFSIPTKYILSSLCEYGDYLAIGCKPKWAGNSVVFLYSVSSSAVVADYSIDWGFGDLQIIEQIEGELVGISSRNNIVTGLGERIIFRHYISGSGAIIFRELLITAGSSVPLLCGRKFNANRLYFLGDFSIDSILHNGVWGIGKNQYGRWIVWFDKLPNNDTAVASNGMRGFFMLGDFIFIAYEDSGYKLTQSSNSTYTGTSLIETVINPNMLISDRTKNKQVKTIVISYEPIPVGGQVICEYKVDGGSWIPIFTETTVGKITTEKEIITKIGREYEFRVKSTGGVAPSEIKYAYDIIKTLV